MVIIEDLDPSHEYMTRSLKIWGDHYPFHAEEKHGGAMIRPKQIIVTSQYHPADIFKDLKTLEAIMRRFKIVHFPTGPLPDAFAAQTATMVDAGEETSLYPPQKKQKL